MHSPCINIAAIICTDSQELMVPTKVLSQTQNQKHETRSSRDFLMLEVPRTDHKTLGDRSFSFTAATQWNALPLELRAVRSFSVFKHQLKTFLFKRSYKKEFSFLLTCHCDHLFTYGSIPYKQYISSVLHSV